VSGDASRPLRRRWWAVGLAVSAVAVVLAIVSLVIRPGELSELAAGTLAGLTVVVLAMWVGLVVYNRRESTLQAELGSQVWTHRCIDPNYPAAWLSLAVSDEAVRVLRRKNRVRDRWPLDTIVDVVVEPMPMGFMQHTCLTLILRGGARASICLPSHSTFSFPKAVAEEAQQEIQRRLAKIRT
jgi:hypothetical protein